MLQSIAEIGFGDAVVRFEHDMPRLFGQGLQRGKVDLAHSGSEVVVVLVHHVVDVTGLPFLT